MVLHNAPRHATDNTRIIPRLEELIHNEVLNI